MTIPHSVSITTYSTYIQCVATFRVHTDDCAMQYELRTADHHHRPLPPLHSGLYSVCGRLLLRLFVFILDVIRCKFTYRLVFPGKDWNSDCAILSVCFTQQFHISAVEANKNNALYTFNKWLATADKKISVMCAVQQRAAEQMGMGGGGMGGTVRLVWLRWRWNWQTPKLGGRTQRYYNINWHWFLVGLGPVRHDVSQQRDRRKSRHTKEKKKTFSLLLAAAFSQCVWVCLFGGCAITLGHGTYWMECIDISVFFFCVFLVCIWFFCFCSLNDVRTDWH